MRCYLEERTDYDGERRLVGDYEYNEGGTIKTETYYFNRELSSVTTYENPFKIYKQD